VQALIIVDVQVAFVAGPEPVPSAGALLAAVGSLLDAARDGDAWVVHLQNDGASGAIDEPGSAGWELHFPVEQRGNEVVLRKSTDDGFQGTDLAELLTAQGIRSVVICGVMSEMCVSATARSALELGFHVVLPHDAHATYDVPAVPGLAAAVPHPMVSRVAEWALGDQIDVIAHAADVKFVP